MRLISTILAFSILFAFNELSAQTKADSSAIFKTMDNWNKAWKIRDAKLAVQDYTEDADWTNAFGMRRIGKDSIQALLEQAFNLPFVMAGESEYEYHDLTFLTKDVALLRSRNIRVGQQLPDGTVTEPRKISHLRVYIKQNDKWLIASHLIGDERTPGKPRD